LLGDMVSEEFVESGSYSKWRNALMGATAGAGAGFTMGVAKPHWFVPDYMRPEELLHAKAKVKPMATKIREERIDPTAKKIDDTLKGLSTKADIEVERTLKAKDGTITKIPQKISERDLISEIMYKTVNEGPEVAQKLMGQTDIQEVMQKLITKDPKLIQAMTQTTGEVNKVIKELGEELVDNGLLDQRIWAKNQDKYIHRTYSKHGAANKTVSEGGYGVMA